MTTQEVSAKTGFSVPAVCKYARILNITHYGEGRRKVYDWSETDVELLKKSIGKRGRPPKDRT
jgi:DNA-binding MurR/RpiR family transcriptional regulator